MESLNDIEVLERDLRAHFPHAHVAIDIPSDKRGTWYVDVRRDPQSLTIQWNPNRGFGLSAKPGGYGEGADEVYSTIAQVESRVAELLDTPESERGQVETESDDRSG
jgi:hypothetical protein